MGTGFKIEKPYTRADESVFIRVELREKEVIEAYQKAVQDSNIKPTPLALKMIKHCLKEAGYLKDNQNE